MGSSSACVRGHLRGGRCFHGHPRVGGHPRDVGNLPLQWHVMESLPQFSKLREALVEEAKVPWRQILSHHTSSPCQPQKSAGPVASLKACGLDTPEQMGQDQYRVVLRLEHSYEIGDNCFVEYSSMQSKKFKECQKSAALDVLCFLLVNRPNGVHLHTSTSCSVDRVRELAEEVRLAYVQAAPPAVEFDYAAAARDRPEAMRDQAPRLVSPDTLTPDA